MIEAVNLKMSPFTPQPAVAEKPEIIFVYGTLKSGEQLNHHILRMGGELIAKDATISGVLYQPPWSHFPMATPGDGTIHGEIWRMPAGMKSIAFLDMVEGVGVGMFRRDKVEARDEKSDDSKDAVLSAWVWFYAFDKPAQGHRIADGRWPVAEPVRTPEM
jgi:gamma-glutamylcyclotransferase (GGCT)/AIG2-like uncharacterized protein YtfP